MTFKAPRAKQIFYGLALLTFSVFNVQLSNAYTPQEIADAKARMGASPYDTVPSIDEYLRDPNYGRDYLARQQQGIAQQQKQAQALQQQYTPQEIANAEARKAANPNGDDNSSLREYLDNPNLQKDNLNRQQAVTQSNQQQLKALEQRDPAKFAEAQQQLKNDQIEAQRRNWDVATANPNDPKAIEAQMRINSSSGNVRDAALIDQTAGRVASSQSVTDASIKAGAKNAGREDEWGNPQANSQVAAANVNGGRARELNVNSQNSNNGELRDDFGANNATPREGPGSQVAGESAINQSPRDNSRGDDFGTNDATLREAPDSQVAGEDAINQPSRSNEFGQENDQSNEMAGQGPQGSGHAAGEEGRGHAAAEEGAGQGTQEEEQGPQQAGGGCSGVWGDNTPTSQACKERAKAGGGGGLGGFAGGLGGLGGGLGQVLNQATGGRGLSGLGDIQKVLQTVQTIASVVDGLKQGPMGVLNSALGAANGILSSADLTGSQVDLTKIGEALGGGNLGGGLASFNAIKDVIPGGIAQGINPNIPSNILNDAGRQVQQAATQSFGKVTGIPAPVKYSGTVGTLGTASV